MTRLTVVLASLLLFAGCNVTTAELAEPDLEARRGAAQTELVVGSAAMLVPRWGAQAVTLNDGRVFVAGGLGGPWSNPVTQTELYTPVRNTWVAGPIFSPSSVSLRLAKLNDGSVLLADDVLARLNPSTLKLLPVTASPFGPTSYRNAELTTLATGEVLVMLAFPGEAWLFTPGALPVAPADGGVAVPADRWTALPAPPLDSTTSLARLADNTVFVLGLRAGAAAAASFNPATRVWTALPAPSQARIARVFALSNNRVAVVPNETYWGSPRTVELFTPSTSTWASVAMRVAHVDGAMALLEDGHTLALAGGLDSSSAVSLVEYLDLDRSLLLSKTESLAQPTQRLTPALATDGRLVLVGGAGTSAVGGGPPAVASQVITPFTGTLDPNLGVKVCTDVTTACAAYAPGRGSVGPEAGAPNTVRPNIGPGSYGPACADGTTGTYLSDESIEAVRVYALDSSNGNFVRGGHLRVVVDVWAWAGFTSDKLDIFIDTLGSGTSWTLAGTLTPTRAGLNTLSLTTTLPAVQNTFAPTAIVRAQFRYGGSAIACTTGPYDDREDVVFQPY